VLAPAAMVAIIGAVVATILWGVLPDIGGDLLRDAANTFVR